MFRIVDRVLPHINPELLKKEKPSVKRSVVMLVIGMALHNIPEGLAIGVGFVLRPALGIASQDVAEVVLASLRVKVAVDTQKHPVIIKKMAVTHVYVHFFCIVTAKYCPWVGKEKGALFPEKGDESIHIVKGPSVPSPYARAYLCRPLLKRWALRRVWVWVFS